jgi:hypothetical protein
MLIIFLMIRRATGAPVPTSKKPKPEVLEIIPGEYMLKWGGFVTYKMVLDKRGNYIWGTDWVGSYSWDSKTRVFGIREISIIENRSRWYTWSVKLDKIGKGKIQEGDWEGVEIEIYKVAKPYKLKLPTKFVGN